MNYYLEALHKYAVFEGRARRKEYWFFVLWNLIIEIVLYLIAIALIMPDSPVLKILSILVLGLYILYALALIIPSLAVGIRRLHDTDHSGWWLLIGFIPVVGAIVLLIFFVLDSQPGDNKYGPNPKGIAAAPSVPTAAATPLVQEQSMQTPPIPPPAS